MTPELWRKVCRSFDELLPLEAHRREERLGRLRADDPAVAAEVESLLRQHEVTQGLDLEKAAAGVWQAAGRPDSAVPPQIGPYVIETCVGRGGMGEVWLGRDQHFRRSLAVKVLAEQQKNDTDLKRRFLEEAQLMGQLQHPGIPPVHDLGTLPDGRPYFTMKLIKGQTLAALLRGPAEPPPEPARLLGIFEQICQTLAAAHAQRVIHRDLKPANVMVGAFGEVQVMDWGLAKVMGNPEPDLAPLSRIRTVRSEDAAAATAAGAALGTPAYMAPEQARGETADLDQRCDVFGLGAILCTLLTGQPPFAAANANDSHRAAMRGDLTAAYARLDASGADAELIGIAKRCLAADPSQRFADAREVAAAVRSYQDLVRERLRQAEVARGQAEVRAREERKRRRLTWIVAAIGCVAVVILALSTVLILGEYHRAEEEKRNALKAKDTAQAKEAETQAVLDFVEKQIFAKAGPPGRGGGLGRNVTLREAMEAALPIIGTSFQDQPLIEARLRLTVGTTFGHLGEPKMAAEQFRRARELYRQHLGGEHPLTLAAMNGLGTSYTALGRYDDALKLLTETLALRQAKLGPDDPDTLHTMNNVGSVCMYLGQFDQARQWYEETLARRSARLGPDHPETMESVHNLANIYEDLGRYGDALTLRERTLQWSKARYGVKNARTLAAMMNLANSYADVGRHEDALRLREECVPLAKELLGPTHSDTISDMGNLAHSYEAVGRHADALKLREEVLPLRTAVSGAKHPYTFRSMYNVALSYRAVGRYADALKLHQEILALRRANLPKDHPDTLMSLYAVAECYADARRYADALKLYTETLQRRKAKLGPEHARTLEVLVGMARAYLETGEYARTEALLEKALAAAVKRQATVPLETADIQHVLGDCLLRQKQFARAESVLRACVATRESKDAHGWKRYASKSLLGAALFGQKRYADAEPLLLDGYEGLRQREERLAAPDRYVVGVALDRLVELYHAWGKAEQAEIWRQKQQSRSTPGGSDKKP